MPRSYWSEEVVKYARSYLHVPYVYGGNDHYGIDCSGFLCAVLRRDGLVTEHEDLSAQGLYDKFKKTGYLVLDRANIPSLSLIFFGTGEFAITHVALALDNLTMIEAGGGNARTDSVEKAKALRACVRERLIKNRSDVVSVIRPKYPHDVFEAK